MHTNTQYRLPIWLAAIASFILVASSISAVRADEEAEAEARAERTYQRYVQLLKRKPQAGVSLDRIYGHHIDRGTLDTFVSSLTDNVEDTDGSNAMILGLIESRRGRDAAARTAFEAAETKRPEDPMVSWYLGQSLVAIGEPDLAAAAMERSLQKNIPRAVQEKVFQMLGRIYQRSQQTDKAMELWKRFEQAFPNDERVQEQIASIQIEENQLEDALARYEAIASKITDPYKRVQFGIKAADLKLKLGQTEDGLAAYETLLQDLKPASWLFNDVRDRIEESYLRTDDYVGLVDYYEKWIASHPDDLDAMSRIGRYLAIQGRADEAEEWYTKAIEKAPSDPKLRLALIEQLIGEKDYPGAIEQYEQLVKIDSGNPDHIERWGMLYLRHPQLSRMEQREKASEIWGQLVEGKEDDAIVVSRVADLFRSAEMSENAIASYRKAIALEPQNPQYREYLGEYLHNLDRSEDAKEVWQAMVNGDQRTTQNLTRLSEVYKSFGYTEEALTTLEAACDMDPEFGDLIRFSNMLRDARRFDDSLTQLGRVAKLAASADETQIILEARIKTLSESGQLPAETAGLERSVSANASAEQWRVLAFYQEAMNRLPDASRSAGKAVEMEPGSIPAWTIAARVMEKAGLLAKASEANRTLSNLDRRFRTQYLKKIAELERRLGRIDNAIQAAKDVITAAPGNPESYRFYSDLCFQLGKPELGLDALRRSVRVNPSDVESLTGLAQALAEQFKTDEAIELYWRAFQKAEKLDGKISVVQTLSELYVQTNSFDKLVTRLKNLSKELSQQRDMVICLANAYQATGDVGLAREELKGLLRGESRDVILLDELALLAEQANEYQEAIEYQKQIVEVAKTDEARSRLASLFLRSGDVDAAEALWAQSAGTDSQPHRQVESIDDLIAADKLATARKLCDALLAKNSEDWDALLRLALIDWKEDRKEDAAKRCEQILSLRQPLDTPSHLKQSKRVKRQGMQIGNRNGRTGYKDAPPYFARQAIMHYMKVELNLSPGNFSQQQKGRGWIVEDFGESRVAALGIQMAAAKDEAQFMKQLQAKAEANIQTDSVPAWDWWYALSFAPQTIQGSISGTVQQLEVARTLQKSGEPAAQYLYVQALTGTLQRTNSGKSVNRESFTRDQATKMIEAWESVRVSKPAWGPLLITTVQSMVVGLRQSELSDLADDLLRRLLRKNARQDELQAALQVSVQDGNIDMMLDVVDRLVQMQRAAPNTSGSSSALTQLGFTFTQQANKLAKQEGGMTSVGKLLVKFLDIKAATFNPLANGVAPGSNTPVFVSSRSPVTTGFLVQGMQRRRVNPTTANFVLPSRYFSAYDQQFFATLNSIFAETGDNQPGAILEDYRSTAAGAQIVFAELALANFSLLNDNVEQAAVHFVRAAAEAPEDASLRLPLVGYYQQRGNHAEALELLNTINAVDQLILKDKELLALDLAMKTANTKRARLAAERLFGLRLDTNTAIQLSNKMQSLDMKEMAAALLARTRKVAGNNVATLLALMKKYQSADDMDVACQIAHQILRQTNGQTISRTGTNPEAARKAAVAVLGKTGQLETLIQRAIDQLSRSPKSVRLHQTLIEYYVAAGNSLDANKLRASLTELIPVTAASLFREGQQLDRGRNYTQACDKYLAALKKDPRSLSQNYFIYLRTFTNAKRLPELADLLLQDGRLGKIQNNYQIATQTVEALYRVGTTPVVGQGNSKSNKKAMELFKAAWKQFPNNRSNLIASINSPAAWSEPEMVEYAKVGLIPSTLQQSIATPWKGLAEGIVGYGPSADAVGTLNRIIGAVRRQPEQRKVYIEKVQAAVKKFDKWHGGKALLAALKADAGDLEAAERLLDQLENDPEVLFVPTNVSWVLGCALNAVDESRFLEISTRLLKNSLAKDNSASNQNDLNRSPERRLALLYSKQGDTENARQALRGWIENMDYSRFSSIKGYRESIQLQKYVAVADELFQIGCPFDALEYYRKVTPELQTAAGRYASRSNNAFARAKSGESKVMAAITIDAALAFMKRNQSDKLVGIDLVLKPRFQKEDSTAIRSLLVDALLQPKRSGERKELAKRLQEILRDNSKANPLPAIVAIEVAVATNDSNLYRMAAERLNAYLDMAPSFKTPSEKSDDLREISLWIAARSAFKMDTDSSFAERLALRAQTAAEASEDDRWLISMMREKGDIAIASGDKATAEKAWSRLLDAVLADSSPPPTTGPSRVIQRPSQQAPTESALDELRNKLLKPHATLTP